MKRSILLLVAVAGLVGCSGPITSTYDAKTDSVECKHWEMGDLMSTWTERGYECHAQPKDRVRP